MHQKERPSMNQAYHKNHQNQIYIMSAAQTEEHAGKAFDDFYESIGNQAGKLSEKTDDVADSEIQDGDGKVVDEIESLCMNCHEQV